MAPSVDQLRKEYNLFSEDAKKYKSANFIFDLEDADSTYLRLLIKRDEKYLEILKIENHIRIPVVKHRLNRYRQLLNEVMV